MKKRILVVLFALALSANLRAQVTIGELAEPAKGALLDLNKAVKGGLALSVVDLPNFYTIPNGFPGIVSQADVTPAVKTGFRGAMVYNTGVTTPPAGIYVWNETNWTPPTDNCLPAENLTLTLKASSIAPAVNVPDTFTVSSNASARCAGSETYTWSVPGANTGDYTVSKVDNRASIQFITAGAYTVKAEVHNSYSAGTATVETTVFAGGVVPASMKSSGYYLTGKPCYDINRSDTYDSRHVATSAAARVATATDFSVSANRTRTYKFCHENYTNLSVSLLEDNGGLVESISQPVGSDQTGVSGCKTFTVTFKDNVETLVNANGYSVKLLASYRDKNDQAKLADMDISVQDGLCGCPAKISSSNWLTFQCHNLGGLDILSSTQTIGREHHGDWYRFGATVASMANTSAHDTNNTWDNSDYQNDSNPWANDGTPICSAGWRLPTNTEWQNVDNNNSWPSGRGWTGFNSVRRVSDYLYLPAAGIRMYSDGRLEDQGVAGYYWSSSAYDGSKSFHLFFGAGNESSNSSCNKTYGLSVRCVAVE